MGRLRKKRNYRLCTWRQAAKRRTGTVYSPWSLEKWWERKRRASTRRVFIEVRLGVGLGFCAAVARSFHSGRGVAEEGLSIWFDGPRIRS